MISTNYNPIQKPVTPLDPMILEVIGNEVDIRIQNLQKEILVIQEFLPRDLVRVVASYFTPRKDAIREISEEHYANLEWFGRDPYAIRTMYKFPDMEDQLKRILTHIAVQKNGYVLQFASKKLQGDRDIVRDAIRSYSGAYFFASKELQGDPEILHEADPDGILSKKTGPSPSICVVL